MGKVIGEEEFSEIGIIVPAGAIYEVDAGNLGVGGRALFWRKSRSLKLKVLVIVRYYSESISVVIV